MPKNRPVSIGSSCRYFSYRVYVRINPKLVHMFRFLLEGYDNLGIMTVVDRWGATLLVRSSPDQQETLHHALDAIGQSIPITIMANLPLPTQPNRINQD